MSKFKAGVALEALKGDRTVPDLAAEYGAHPPMIHRWKRSLLDGAAGIVERGGKAKMAAAVAEEAVRHLHAKIGDRTAQGAASTTSSSSVSDTAGRMSALLARLGDRIAGPRLASGAGSPSATTIALILPMGANPPAVVYFNTIETAQQVQPIA